MSDETNVYMHGQMRHGMVRCNLDVGVGMGRLCSSLRTLLKDKQSWGCGNGVGKEDSQAKATGPALGHGVWMGGQ